MKPRIVLSILTSMFFAACGSQHQSSTEDDQGTVNDLPNVILQCVEAYDGAEVQDGRVELTLGKDQFGLLEIEIIQKDQFSGDYVLGLFIGVEKTNANGTIYKATAEGKQMTLTIKEADATTNKSIGELVLTTDGTPRTIGLSCRG
ncbi:MAG: hypothetical protein AB7T49_17925 [Oligoflexales bacterium]